MFLLCRLRPSEAALELLHILLHNLLHIGGAIMSVFKRGGAYQMRRRVPRRYREIEPRGTIWISLHTDSESIAHSKAKLAWAQLTEVWEARLAGHSVEAEVRYQAVQDLARLKGFRYLEIASVAAAG